MANTLNGNTFYIDTQGSSSTDDLLRKQTLVKYVVVTATAANGRIVLSDAGPSPVVKIDLRVEISGRTEVFNFEESPILFPNGIRVSTLSNAVGTAVLTNSGG